MLGFTEIKNDDDEPPQPESSNTAEPDNETSERNTSSKSAIDGEIPS
jgi:hypothetical protein